MILETLPASLQETYYQILNDITSTRRKYVIRILQFLAYSDIQLELEAAVDALAINLTAPPGSRFIMKERMPLPAEISSLCSTLFVTVSQTKASSIGCLIPGEWYIETSVLQLAHSSVEEFISSCPSTEFDGLLTEPISKLTITEICLVYFLEADYFLPEEEFWKTHHFMPFAVHNWLHDASRRGSILNNFTHLSMELFSNNLLFNRWRELIEDRLYKTGSRHRYSLSGQDQLFYAIWSGDEICADKLLNASVTGHTTAWKLNPALHIASGLGYVETVALLIRKGADVNAKGKTHNVLCTAVLAGHLDVVALLAKRGAHLDAQQGRDGNALELACRCGRLDIIELLIEQGANVNTPSNALSHACFVGDFNVVKLLVDKGANIYTGFENACINGHLDVVMFLLERGAKINVRVRGSDTSLQLASKYGHLDIVEYLLEKGADVNAQGSQDSTALYSASIFGNLNIVKHLVEKGADVNAQGGPFGTALCNASRRGDLNIVRYLVQKGADVNAPGGYFENALEGAIISKNYETAEFLQNHKASLRYVNMPNTNHN
ncbi:hypothetical protein BFJ72_g7484 [Fusarium proliferatum]|uniref:Uncharacterized protein n=1 Tax=Gibberella intermedia TaxID=948311 RepID=A0A420T911_GIBIN|nr:hypothetical protein BFJ72_g7484 [Fusarium proliferatum]